MSTFITLAGASSIGSASIYVKEEVDDVVDLIQTATTPLVKLTQIPRSTSRFEKFDPRPIHVNPDNVIYVRVAAKR